MRTNTQTLLDEFATLAALLRGEVRIHANHLMSSLFSFGFKDVEKGTPRGIHDGLRKMMVLDHIRDVKVLNGNMMVLLGVVFGRLKVEITALTIDLQMGLGHEPCGDTAAMTALLAPTQGTLLASKRFVRAAIVTWVLNGLTVGVGKEDFQAHINADIRMRTRGGKMVGMLGGLADDQCVPVAISTQDQMSRFRSTFKRTMQLDLDELAQLGREMKMLVIIIQPNITACSILTKLDRVPLVPLLKAGEATFVAQFFGGKKTCEGFRETISQHLYRGGRHMLTTATFKECRQLILRRERTFGLILLFHRLKHLIVDMPGLDQTVHEQMMLCFIRIQTIFKCFHHPKYSALGMIHQQLYRLGAGGNSSP